MKKYNSNDLKKNFLVIIIFLFSVFGGEGYAVEEEYEFLSKEMEKIFLFQRDFY